MFGNIIRTFRVNNGLSQTMFVDLVQTSSSHFRNLDVVTLSRWERGVTTPHFKRQNELLNLIGANIFDVWQVGQSKKHVEEITKKLNKNGYLDTNQAYNTEVVTINSNNSYLINGLSKLIDVIFDYEENLIFHALEKTGLSRQAIITKIINQYGGDLILVTVNGQLISHLLSSNDMPASDFLELGDIYKKEQAHQIITFNCTYFPAFIYTMSKEVYKYLQSLNPDRKIYLFINNKKMFDLFFSLGFEYRTITRSGQSMKLMYSEVNKIKSNRSWVSLISNYKGDGYE
ncbi:helix-turn-helix domain-containing protein [Vibrio sp. nBUS_14]|uniref:helix-turn-helix domain-containing protein n=1 Tax=unclassified Vibrio TaxID=2614977 RepID=UPI003EBA8718